MFKMTFVFTLTLCFVAIMIQGKEPYGFNPALNPVRLKKATEHDPLELVKDGKPQFAIAFDHNVEKKTAKTRRSIRNAVSCLNEAFKKCFGFNVPVVDANSPDLGKKFKYLILVGKSILTDKLGLKPLTLPKEGFEVSTYPGGVAIAGYDGSIVPGAYTNMDWGRYRLNGTLNGCYDFIERILGVRFYFPGTGTIWPENTELTIQPVRYQDWPEFKSRFSWAVQHSLSKKNWPAECGEYHPVNFEEKWRLGYGNRFQPTHSPTPRTWAKVHPDKLDTIFYRSPNGHLYYNPKAHIGSYFDVTNLKVADLLIDDCLKYYQSNGKWDNSWRGWQAPNSEYILFGQCDTFLPELSNKTVTSLNLIPEARRGSRHGALSDVYSRFHIALAEKIKKEFPGKRLAIMPYQNYALPPLKPEYRKFPDNIDIRLCIGDFPAKITNPDIIKKWRKRFANWVAVLGGRPVSGLWLYNAPNDPFGRAVIPCQIGNIPKAMGNYLGREGMYFDFWGPFDWEHAYAYYVMYRSMWNPAFNVNAALDEYWSLMYGKAAPHLKEFHSLLVKNWNKHRAATDNLDTNYPIKELDKMENQLKQAEQAIAPDSVEMRRFRLFIKPWAKAFAQMRGRHKIEKQIYRVKQLLPEETIVVDGNMDTTWEQANVFNMTDPMGSGEAAKYKVEGRMKWNKQGLYVLLEMFNLPEANNEFDVWHNSNIELFLSPGLKQEEYFQFAIDAVNQFFSGKRTMKPIATPYNAQWSCPGFQHAVSVAGGKWTVELVIPFQGLGLPAPRPAACWFANVIRNKNSKPKEYSSFAPTLGNNHKTNMYNMIKFLPKGD